ncbi:hypothetical protein [Pseudomonas sp.]|uniref:hypothetical protein n=1 Tax=Pseudomonas sp. TaxID=306 RepID=UPI002735A4CB|nr:hypothetical protein [Pseudomonas sp.]MDP2746176.1 hypothetical protein [Pseudomonas sp.]
MSTLKDAITAAGGAVKVSSLCGVSPRAVYKWMAANYVPRTEYTGETNYLGLIAAEASARGQSFDLDSLKQELAERRNSGTERAAA